MSKESSIRKMVLVPFEKYQRMLQQKDGSVSESNMLQHVEQRESGSKSPPGQGVVENTTPVSTDSVTFDRILQSISKQFRSRAKLLLKFIEQSDNKIGWSSQGELTVSGHSVKNSNIGELVRHAMKTYVRFKPVGMNEFY